MTSAHPAGFWLRQLEREIERLAVMLLAAYPEGQPEHRRARWSVIRVQVFFELLRAALGLSTWV